jgi:hypothetical protein
MKSEYEVFFDHLIEYVQALENEVGGRNPYYCNKLKEMKDKDE